MHNEQIVPHAQPEDLNPTLCQRFRTVLSPPDDREFLQKLNISMQQLSATFRRGDLIARLQNMDV